MNMKRLLFNLKKKGKSIGQKFNFSLLAEVSALLFLGVSEHPMNTIRWIILIVVLVTSLIAFIANE